MGNFKIVWGLAITLMLSMNSQAQSPDHEAVRKVIDQLFEGMRQGDSSMVSGLFHPKAIMMSSYRAEDGTPALKEGSLRDFLTAIGTPHPEIWNEEIWDTEIAIDDDLAQVWTNYAFYEGEKFSHCGIDAFQLVRGMDGQWRIIHLMDTRRKEPCEKP